MDVLRGDCLTCLRIDTCNEVSIELVKQSHTCPLFREVTEPVYLARLAMMKTYGDDAAIDAMINRPPEPEELEGEIDDAESR